MWISAGERYRISNGVVLRNQSIVILPADSRYVDVSITVERCVDDVDFTVKELLPAMMTSVERRRLRRRFELCCKAFAIVAAGSSSLADQFWSREVPLETSFQTRHFLTGIVAGYGRRRKREVVECALFVVLPVALFSRAGIP
ncbi:hypothetical protein F511_33708 [Dorcoceras hygrometricum]|uniref:Uncharacterized protein n=1 Tax=Dorcoceras hygrometricum TaxID=472368 RepID=A0A2Z7BMR9_9LAMI|nr:hypothetical protein F511_33708 [Dorcoceras hygrometricum]